MNKYQQTHMHDIFYLLLNWNLTFGFQMLFVKNFKIVDVTLVREFYRFVRVLFPFIVFVPASYFALLLKGRVVKEKRWKLEVRAFFLVDVLIIIQSLILILWLRRRSISISLHYHHKDNEQNNNNHSIAKNTTSVVFARKHF